MWVRAASAFSWCPGVGVPIKILKKVGLFDEMGSVYSHDIVSVRNGEGWEEVEHTPAQLKLKKDLKRMGW